MKKKPSPSFPFPIYPPTPTFALRIFSEKKIQIAHVGQFPQSEPLLSIFPNSLTHSLQAHPSVAGEIHPPKTPLLSLSAQQASNPLPSFILFLALQQLHSLPSLPNMLPPSLPLTQHAPSLPPTHPSIHPAPHRTRNPLNPEVAPHRHRGEVSLLTNYLPTYLPDLI